MDNNNQWQQQPYGTNQQNMASQPYGVNMSSNASYSNYYAQPVNNKKGLSIATLILGILSVTICCCLGFIPSAIGIIIGVIALIKEPKGRIMSVIGLVLCIVSLVLTLLANVIGLTDAFMEGLKEGYESGVEVDDIEDLEDLYEDLYDELNEVEDSEDEVLGQKEEHFWSEKYMASDESTIYFNEDDTFEWFLTDSDYDNANVGTYQVIFGEEAREWLVEEHPEYGVTDEELEDYFDRNSDSDLYTKDNLTVLILATDVLKIDGEQQNEEPYITYYYGYSNESVFDGVNLSTFNYFLLENVF